MSNDPVNVRIARDLLKWTDVQSIGIRGGVEKWVGIPPLDPNRPQIVCDCRRWPERKYVFAAAPNVCAYCNDTGFLTTPQAYEPIPDFEHDDAATVPLITRFKLAVGWNGAYWVCQAWAREGEERRGESLLAAACSVLLQIAEREQGGQA